MEKLNLIEKRKISVEELVKYYSKLRKIDYDNGSKLKGINLRKRIHFICAFILKIDQLLSKEKIVIVKDLHNTFSKRPRIYACTHSGGQDVERSLQIIKEPSYLMLGDPGILYKMPAYQGLKLNGVIPLESTDKIDRKIAYSRAIELLNKGGNLLIFPEGAWNVTPNLPVMKIFNGTIRMAKETNAEIVPVGVEQYGNTFYFNIGKNYTIPVYSTESIEELRDDLREKLCTLKWEIMETQPELKRKGVQDNHLEVFQKEIIDRCNPEYGFTLEDAIAESYHDKNITTEEEVFSFLPNLKINTSNAFLIKDKLEFTKRLTLTKK